MNAWELAKQLAATGAVTVVTTQGEAPLAERAPLDAITVIQLDGDVVSYFREGASLERHFAALRQMRGTLRRLELCYRTTSRGAFWAALLGAQYAAHAWVVEALGAGGLAAFGDELARPEHYLRSAGGAVSWVVLRGIERLLRRAVRRALSNGSPAVFSARVAHARS